ncbi:MAG: hypothetical protein KCCBMMGE_01228 [Candidatus Methanoperedenaceae archaeon GB37]|nr:MAG: hypothetical protein KCCBMMGE_01228 [Candidatus Methanoperedenaceae archaeon GB37]
MKKIFMGILIVILSSVIIYILFPKSSKPKILKTAKVWRGPITAFVEETGIVKPQVGALIKVGTRATGLLTYLPYQVGDFVKKGELLALIDDREILANLNSAKATLKSLQAELQLIDATYPLQIKEQEAKVQAAKARYDYAVINLSREEILLKQEFTTQDSVDQAQKRRDVKWADYQVALETLNRLKEEYKQKRHSLLAKINAQKRKN